MFHQSGYSAVLDTYYLSIFEFTVEATTYYMKHFAGGGKWKNLADRSMITSMSNSMFAQAKIYVCIPNSGQKKNVDYCISSKVRIFKTYSLN